MIECNIFENGRECVKCKFKDNCDIELEDNQSVPSLEEKKCIGQK